MLNPTNVHPVQRCNLCTATSPAVGQPMIMYNMCQQPTRGLKVFGQTNRFVVGNQTPLILSTRHIEIQATIMSTSVQSGCHTSGLPVLQASHEYDSYAYLSSHFHLWSSGIHFRTKHEGPLWIGAGCELSQWHLCLIVRCKAIKTEGEYSNTGPHSLMQSTRMTQD